MVNSFLSDPLWMRLGLSEPHTEIEVGEGVGIVITDTVINHPLITHLAGRLKRVVVSENGDISCHDVVLEEEQLSSPYPNEAEHGMSALLLLAHLPFTLEGKLFAGLVPKATFIVIDYHQPDLLKKGMEWIINNRDHWNVKVVINFQVIGGNLSMRSPKEEPLVQALMPAVKAGLLVVTANGNSPAINNNSPLEFLAVGGYDDGGVAGKAPLIHPMSSFGENGDGHFRPDLLAPFTYLPVPFYECSQTDLYTPYIHPETGEQVSYFGGTCGAATIIGGLCAYFFSKYPQLDSEALRHHLIHTGTLLKNKSYALTAVSMLDTLQSFKDMKIIDASSDRKLFRINSDESVKRGRELTQLIEQGAISRETLWQSVKNESPCVQKVAIWGLGKPLTREEKDWAWSHFHREKNNIFGVREAWGYMLLMGADISELTQWMQLIMDVSADIRWCVRQFLKQHYPDAPHFDHTPDTNHKMIHQCVTPTLTWYECKIGKERKN